MVIRMLHRTSSTILCTVLAGCLAEPTTSGTVEVSARDQFMHTAWPVLATCAGCHGKQPAIDFLAPGTAEGAYETIFDFQPPVLDVDAPSASLLLTMGKHTGPAMSPDQAATVLSWLAAERSEKVGDGGGDGADIRVGPFMPQHGVPTVFDLGVGGATLSVTTEPSEGGLYACRITLASGSGLKLSHPLFVSRPAHPIVDEIDRFAEVELSLAAGKTVELGPAWFRSFAVTDYLAIHFKTLEAP